MEKKKIILIAPAFPYRGGIAATTDRLAQEYVNRGEEVEIWTYKLLYPKIIFPGKTQYLADGHEAPEGVVIKRKISSVNPFNWIKVGRELKKLQPKQIIIRYWLPVFAPCLGAIAKRAKSKETEINCLVDNVIPHEKRPGDRSLSNYFFKQVDGFVVMAKEGVDQLKHTFNIKVPITYSPHPLFDIYGDPVSKEVACQKLGLPAENNYILSFGLVRKYKGIDLLIKAFAEFRVEQPDYQLIIAGESYDDWDTYEQLITELGLSEAIIRIDEFIANEDVKYFFSAAEYLALTYRSATQSGVTQIAYSMHLPMLVTDVGDLSNMVPHDVVGQVCQKDQASIVRSLYKMSEKATLKQYRENIQQEKERFSWTHLCDNLDQFIDEQKVPE